MIDLVLFYRSGDPELLHFRNQRGPFQSKPPAVPTLAIVATCAETPLGILLLLGWQTRTTALLSGGFVLLFAVTMTGALRIKAPLDASVFSAAGGAFLLASCAEYPFSIDQLRRDSVRDA